MNSPIKSIEQSRSHVDPMTPSAVFDLFILFNGM